MGSAVTKDYHGTKNKTIFIKVVNNVQKVSQSVVVVSCVLMTVLPHSSNSFVFISFTLPHSFISLILSTSFTFIFSPDGAGDVQQRVQLEGTSRPAGCPVWTAQGLHGAPQGQTRCPHHRLTSHEAQLGTVSCTRLFDSGGPLRADSEYGKEYKYWDNAIGIVNRKAETTATTSWRSHSLITLSLSQRRLHPGHPDLPPE